MACWAGKDKLLPTACWIAGVASALSLSLLLCQVFRYLAQAGTLTFLCYLFTHVGIFLGDNIRTPKMYSISLLTFTFMAC